MNAQDIEKLTKLGFVVPRKYERDEYVLVEAKSMKSMLKQVMALRLAGRIPITIQDERLIETEICPDCQTKLKETSIYCPGCGQVVK